MQLITTHKKRNEDVAMENNKELFWFLSRCNCILFLMRFCPSQAEEPAFYKVFIYGMYLSAHLTLHAKNSNV